MNNEAVSAAVIIIGNEILSGRTQDANLSFLGRRLSDLGIELAEVRVIPDDEAVIIETLNHCRRRFNYVFTTGGIGPTHDDITSATVAMAFNVELEQNTEALSCLQRYYGEENINDARLRMANIPVGAVLIHNPISGAPGFQLENVFVLPGVPLIMQAMFDGITDRLTGGPPILSRSIATNLREGVIAPDLATIQQRYPAVTIGSYPWFKAGRLGVNLVIRGTDDQPLQSAAKEIIDMIHALKGKVLKTE